MLNHRLMIAKRLYSILKRNVINRFVHVFPFGRCARVNACVWVYTDVRCGFCIVPHELFSETLKYFHNTAYNFPVFASHIHIRSPAIYFHIFVVRFDTINFIFVRWCVRKYVVKYDDNGGIYVQLRTKLYVSARSSKIGLCHTIETANHPGA